MEKVVKTEAAWRAQLTPEQYRIMREHGTESAFCGGFWDHDKVGTYHCAGCEAPLFESATKFDSGTGWPSYNRPTIEGNITRREDSSWGMHRTEVLCSRCDSHLGHVFSDGPQPTGLRYCINSAALNFVEDNNK